MAEDTPHSTTREHDAGAPGAGADAGAGHSMPSGANKWRVTPAQKTRLVGVFAAEPYPPLSQKNSLADELGVTNTQISKWFQHRRESLTRQGQFKAQYNRTRRTREELDILQDAFERNPYPNADRLAELEEMLESVSVKQIKLWFKHRRKQSATASRSSAEQSTRNSKPFSQRRPTPEHSREQNGPVSSARTPVSRPSTPPLPTFSTSPSLQANNNNVNSRIALMSPDAKSPAHHIASVQQHPPAPANGPCHHAQQDCMSVTHYPHYMHPPHYSYQQQVWPQTVPAAPASAHLQPPGLHPHFSQLELMAMGGVLVVSNTMPSSDALQSLSGFLGRPVDLLTSWFAAQTQQSGNPIHRQDVQMNSQNRVYVSPGQQHVMHGHMLPPPQQQPQVQVQQPQPPQHQQLHQQHQQLHQQHQQAQALPQLPAAAVLPLAAAPSQSTRPTMTQPSSASGLLPSVGNIQSSDDTGRGAQGTDDTQLARQEQHQGGENGKANHSQVTGGTQASLLPPGRVCDVSPFTSYQASESNTRNTISQPPHDGRLLSDTSTPQVLAPLRQAHQSPSGQPVHVQQHPVWYGSQRPPFPSSTSTATGPTGQPAYGVQGGQGQQSVPSLSAPMQAAPPRTPPPPPPTL